MARKDSRLFARFDLDYADHPKIVGLSDAAFRAHVEMILYARKYKTDGVIANRVANRFGFETLRELCANDPDAPSLIDNGDGSYTLHGYGDMNETRAEIEERSARNRGNGAKGGRPRKRDETHSVTESRTHSGSEIKPRTKAETETETEAVTPNGVTPLTPQGGKQPKAKGTRLVADWMPSAELIAQMRGECPQVDLQAEHRIFVDYWIAQPGQKGVKLDWPATWRNWMRRKQGDQVKGAPKTFGQQKQENTLALVERLREEEGRAAVGSGDAPGVRALGAGW